MSAAATTLGMPDDASAWLSDWDFLQVDPASPCRHYLLRQDEQDCRLYHCEVCARPMQLRPLVAR